MIICRVTNTECSECVPVCGAKSDASEQNAIETNFDKLYKLVGTLLYNIHNEFEYQNELDPYLKDIRSFMNTVEY